jgi:hypothetical protein
LFLRYTTADVSNKQQKLKKDLKKNLPVDFDLDVVGGHIMRLDDVWLQTTLNTPYISGVWQIKRWSVVSLKAHQPRQGQSPLAGLLVKVYHN